MVWTRPSRVNRISIFTVFALSRAGFPIVLKTVFS